MTSTGRISRTSSPAWVIPETKNCVLVTPLGSALSPIFEEKLGFSFTKTDLNHIQNKLPRLLVEDMELAENVDIQIQGKVVTIEITGSVID